MNLNFAGIIVGVISFLIIGLFHPIVIKCEYYFTYRIWPIFLVGGGVCCGLSLVFSNFILSASLSVLGFTMLWTIKELKEQDERVKKGWFPENPNRKKKDSETVTNNIKILNAETRENE